MREIHSPYGRVFEDFHTGDLIRHWPGRTVTQADNLLFSLLSLNQHPLHIDAHFAEGTSRGRNLVNGTLLFAIEVGMTTSDLAGAALAHLGYETIVHLQPVFDGESLYARSEILSKSESRSKKDRGVVVVETTVQNHHGTDVLRFRGTLLVPKRAFATRPHTHLTESPARYS